MAITKASVLKKVEQFLETYRPMGGGGGWPEVPDEDMDELASLIRLMIDAKFSRDGDGDTAVEFLLVNRTEERMPYFRPTPYTHKNPEEALERALSNLSTATAEMNQAIRMRPYEDPKKNNKSA
jgi:hypothetical protein